jgi:glyoxylase-like metal-dependent hydrolase (beta-lactamase superfamily II)
VDRFASENLIEPKELALANEEAALDGSFFKHPEPRPDRMPGLRHPMWQRVRRRAWVHRFTIGNFELSILSDGRYFTDGGAMFGVVPKILWELKMPTDSRNRVGLGLNSLLIRGGARTVLVETGMGSKLPEKIRGIYDHQPRLLESLEEAGVAPEEVGIVINTHLHFDHCGWNTRFCDGRVLPTFPRARYYIQQGEWEHAHHANERDFTGYLGENYDPLAVSGQLELIEGDREILPGISVRRYPGHTRDLQAVLVSSGGQTACYVSDLIPTMHHLEIPWVMGYDSFPLETMEQKKRFYAEAIPNRWLVLFPHDPAVPLAYVERGGDGKFAARLPENEPAATAA